MDPNRSSRPNPPIPQREPMMPRFLPLLLALLTLTSFRASAQNAPPEVTLHDVLAENNASAVDQLGPVLLEPMTDFAQIPNDFWTMATYGDWLLKNDLAGLAISKIVPNDPFRSGVVLDIFPNAAAPEDFQILTQTTSARATKPTIQYDTTRTGESPEGGRVLTMFGRETTVGNVTVETSYRMEKDWPGVLARTVLRNNGTSPVTIPGFADYISFGGMTPFVSGSGYMTTQGLVENCEFVFGRRFDSYVMVMPVEGLFSFRNNGQFATAMYGSEFQLAPEAERAFERWVVTASGDPGELFSFVLQQGGAQSHGHLAGRVKEEVVLPDGSVVESEFVEGAEVRVSVVKRPDLPGDYTLRPYIFTVTDASGNYRIAVPPGEYQLTPTTRSRFGEGTNVALRVDAGRTKAADLPVTQPSRVVYTLTDAASGQPMPGKITFEPLRGTETPYFGPPGRLESSNTVYTINGRGSIEVPEGNYRVIASRGNEYHIEEKRLRVTRGRTQDVTFALERAFESPGWIAADLGVMTNASSHSRISPADRIVTAVAEGVEWLVTADLETITDLSDAVRQLRLGDMIKTSQGLRISSTVDDGRGEFLLFPTEICSVPPSVEDILQTSTPVEAADRIRALCPQAVLVASRPLFPLLGLLSNKGYDWVQGTRPESLDPFPDIDAMQVWEGKRQPLLFQSVIAWNYTMAKTGERIVPVANSLSAGTYNEEPGYPRVYIRTDTEEVSELDPKELAESIREGRVVITNGPFVDVKVNGQGPGSTVIDTDGSVDVELQVFTPNWANVASVSIELNGRFVRKFVFPAGSVDPMAGRIQPRPGEEEEDQVRSIRVSKDSILTINVQGDPTLPQDPVNPLSLPTNNPNVPQGQYTYALTGPIYIDADGDGLVNPDLSIFTRQPDEIDNAGEEEVPPF